MAYPGTYGAARVNGGIINSQTLTGGMRFFKIVGPFQWAVSDGTVTLPVSTAGGGTFPAANTSYFTVGNGRPVPGSAAEIVLQVISQQADIVLIGFSPGVDGLSTEMDIAVSASAFGWGSDYPNYQLPPATFDNDENQLPMTVPTTTSPTQAAIEMQAAIQALSLPVGSPIYTVYGPSGIGTAPVSSTVSFSAVTVTEVSFSLGNIANYYTLA